MSFVDKKKVIIIGAAGRDFHDYNVLFRADPSYEVVAFTAAQIPYISDRMYPKELSGKLYPNGIKIYDESELPWLIKKFKVDICIMAYSDLPYDTVMEKASLCNANGADFWLIAPERTMLKSSKPIISICAVRTGSGKSQTARYVSRLLRDLGLKIVVIRHPMPYGILKDQAVERFATMKDLDKYKTTIEEREDYEPHIRNRFIVYAGVDYEKILHQAESESDLIIWDGGNNDTSFYRPDLSIAVTDPLRAGNELNYYPGATVARMADVIIINKVNSATKEELRLLEKNIKELNKNAKVVYADSIVIPDNPKLIKGKRVLVIEDGPTITHGGMRLGAGMVAAKEYGAKEIVRAKDYAVGEIKKMFDKYPKLDLEMPAIGYSPKQIKDLETSVNNADCDVIVSATPTNLRNLINVNKPIVQVNYELKPNSSEFDNIIKNFVNGLKK
ncbi:MAG: cyclic 2,3-diphosphoglycerate synthase [Candidatus Micrarchaeaceae archaeon]|jgi:predicted GTPase